jgi:hypothetical protein
MKGVFNMKTNKKLLTVLAVAFIFGTLIGCNKKNDTALAEMNAKLEAMQAELDKAKSGNAAPEEIAKLESAVTEIAQQEQAAEQKQEAAAPATNTTTQTVTPVVATKNSGNWSINNGHLTINNGVTSIGDRTFQQDKTITSVTIPNSVTSIGEGAFNKCDSLTSVVIPNSVTSIGKEAFYSCLQLATVTIGSGVASIGENAFDANFYLTSITIDANNPYFSSVDGIVYNKEKTKLILIPPRQTNVNLPNGITSIGDKAFYGKGSLTSVTIPNSVASIGQQAFENCKSLTSVTIGSGVTTIGSRAFFRCEKLASITIPNRVTRIEDNIFNVCYNLTSITFQGTINSNNLHSLAFNGIGDLRAKYLAGGSGTYTRASGGGDDSVWTKQ